MSEYLPSFIVEPVLRQARRFSSRTGDSDTRAAHLSSAGDLHLHNSQLDGLPRTSTTDAVTSSTINRSDPATTATDPSPSQIAHPGYLPSLPDFDFQRFYPSRYWTSSVPLSPSAENGTGTHVSNRDRDETTEGTWQSLARNIQLWANQINNLDVIPSPPLDPMSDLAIADEDGTVEFPPLDEPEPVVARPSHGSMPVRLDEQQRTISETSLNPAEELPYRSRAFAELNRGHAQSDPMNHPGLDQPATMIDTRPLPADIDSYRRRDGSGALPEDDGMGPLRQRITAIMASQGSAAEKSRLIHILMTENYSKSQTPPPQVHRPHARIPADQRPLSPLSMTSTQIAQPIFDLSKRDLVRTYAPPDIDEEGVVQHTPDLGCKHYKRNVKMQCATCEKWYTCRLCHDEVEDHALPRRDTRYMLCMLCSTPQAVAQVCKTCDREAACYYCAICKLWNNDPEKSIYHCDDCGICRLGQGLGKDFFHCKTCAACMSIAAEMTHRCIEKSTKSDCPICGEYMFTSNRPVAFMKCGHSIHESCFTDWCQTSYKCPICSKSIANMETQFRRLDRAIQDQPMPEEYRDNRAYVFCNDCNSRSITSYHWLGLKCTICASYNTTQLELLGPEQTPQQVREMAERAQEYGEAGFTASQSATPSAELTSPFREGIPVPARNNTLHHDIARSPNSPHLLPHSPTRSARSVTPVVGSYFGTGQGSQADEARRGSYFSIFSAGQPGTPQSSRGSHLRQASDESDPGFWGPSSPRSAPDLDMVELDDEDSASSSENERSDDGADDEEQDDDFMDLLGHR